MGNIFYFQWEADFIIWIQSHMGTVGEKLAYYASSLGEEVVLILMLGFLYWCYDKKIGLHFGLNMLFASLFFPVIKNMVCRRRPYMDIAEIKCLKPVEPGADLMDVTAQGYSFPSGHSANSASSWGSLTYLFKNKFIRIIGVVVPFLVGVSRFCLGVHYPTDVLAGWALGTAGILLVGKITQKVRNKKKAYLITGIIACCGAFVCRSNDYFTSLGMLAGLFAANLFEEKYVNFKPTRDPLACVLRIAGGGAIYLALNTFMKLPFSDEFLASATAVQFAFRFIRYAIILFIDIAIYPMLFGKIIKEKKNCEIG